MLISNSPNVEQMFNVDFLFFLSNCLINMFNSFDDPYGVGGGPRLRNIAVRAYKKLLLRGLLHRTG